MKTGDIVLYAFEGERSVCVVEDSCLGQPLIYRFGDPDHCFTAQPRYLSPKKCDCGRVVTCLVGREAMCPLCALRSRRNDVIDAAGRDAKPLLAMEAACLE